MGRGITELVSLTSVVYLSFKISYRVKLDSAYFLRQNCARPLPNVLNTKKPGFNTWLLCFPGGETHLEIFLKKNSYYINCKSLSFLQSKVRQLLITTKFI